MSSYDDSDIINIITHYQKSIERHTKSQNEQKVLHSLHKLRKLPIKVRHLEQTGIGRTVNALRKEKHEVGDAARALVAKWKNMVVEEDSQPSGSGESGIEDSESNDMQEDDRHESIDVNRSSNRGSSSSSTKDDHVNSRSKSTKYVEDGMNIKQEHKEHKSVKRKHEDHEEDSKHKHKKSKRSHHDDENKHNSRHSKHSSSKSSDKKINDNEKEKNSSNTKSSSSSSSASLTTRDKDSKHKSDNSSSNHSKNVTSDDRDQSNTERIKHKSKSSSHKEKRDEKRDNEESSNSSSKSKKKLESKDKTKSKNKVEVNRYRDGIDSGSGASFAEALGMLEPPCSSKTVIKHRKVSPIREEIKKDIKKTPKVETNVREKSPVQNLLQTPKLLEPVDINLSSLLPQITPNYRPMNLPLDTYSLKQKQVAEDEALSYVISSKNQRTKVYSGNKNNLGEIPTLFEMCSRILQDNIDALEYTGGVPYHILKPILEKATPDQLFTMEHHNPYIVEDSDELWVLHCKKQFRNKQREEMESWRDMYMRCLDEREAKLKTLTANIKQSQDKSLPVRQTKLAYVDSIVKPPRSVQRKQMKNGIMTEVRKPSVTPQSRLAALATAGSAGQIAVPNPGQRAVSSGGSSSGNVIIKPKKAPLMQKALALIKSRFRR